MIVNMAHLVYLQSLSIYLLIFVCVWKRGGGGNPSVTHEHIFFIAFSRSIYEMKLKIIGICISIIIIIIENP